jgi:DNA-directed RNA polymerase subunit L
MTTVAFCGYKLPHPLFVDTDPKSVIKVYRVLCNIHINKKVQQVCGTHRTCMYNIVYSNDKKTRTKKETKCFDSDVDCNNYVDIQII